jgi:Fe-S cluster biogenesis protein NfuA
MKRQVHLHIEGVPNPNAMKFVLENGLLTDKPYEFKTYAEASVSPLAQKIMMLRYVERVMLNQNYVTVVKQAKNSPEWDKVLFEIRVIISQHLENNDPILYVGSETLDHTASDDIAVQMAVDLMNKFIRPAAQEDGGDIVFEKYENGILTVSMHGACHKCPHIMTTIKKGLEPVLQGMIPEIKEVKPILI